MNTDIKEFVNGRGLLQTINELDFQTMPILKFVSLSENKELRVLIGGRCSSCRSSFLRNTCNNFFCKEVLNDIILDKYPDRVLSIKPVSTYDDDFKTIVSSVGGTIVYNHSDLERDDYLIIQQFITDKHPDIDGHIKALIPKKGTRVPDVSFLNRREMLTHFDMCWFIADSTKMVLTDGRLVFGEEILDNEDKFLPGFEIKTIQNGDHEDTVVALCSKDGVATNKYATIKMTK